MIDRNPTRI